MADTADSAPEVMNVILQPEPWSLATGNGWASLIVFVSNLFIMQTLIHFVRQLITADVLEYAEVDTFKDSLRNVLTNIGLVSALILTITIAMHQAVMEPKGELTVQLYLGACISATVMCSFGLSEAVIGLVYTEPLNNIDAFKYAIRNAGCIGSPVIFMVIGVTNLGFALTVWTYHEYGLEPAITCSIGMAFLPLQAVMLSNQKAKFNPQKEESFAWALAGDSVEVPTHRVRKIYHDRYVELGKKLRAAVEARDQAKNGASSIKPAWEPGENVEQNIGN
jgi:hypothetical protein